MPTSTVVSWGKHNSRQMIASHAGAVADLAVVHCSKYRDITVVSDQQLRKVLLRWSTAFLSKEEMRYLVKQVAQDAALRQLICHIAG